jgi:hypothetical protein
MGSARDIAADPSRTQIRARPSRLARVTLHPVIAPQHKPLALTRRCHPGVASRRQGNLRSGDAVWPQRYGEDVMRIPYIIPTESVVCA